MSEGTIAIENILVQCTKKCECELPDPDDCLILSSLSDILEVGLPVCPECTTVYDYDNMAILAKMV
jgi:hypothetical protein